MIANDTIRPWSWYIPAIIALFFGIGGGAVTYYLNLRRCGRQGSNPLVKTIVIVVICFVVTYFGARIEAPRMLISAAISPMFLLFQKEEVEYWVMQNLELKLNDWWRAIGWGMIGAVGYVIFIFVLAMLFDVPLSSPSRNLRPLR